MGISRRQFLETTAAGALVANQLGAAGAMPTAVLGKTGVRVSRLAFGGGSRFLSYPEDKGYEALTRALELGITYVDTAQGYGKGESQTRLGKFFKARGGKKDIFLASKVGPDRTYDGFMRGLDESLKRLQMDQVDLLHIHQLMGPDDYAKIKAPDGAYKALLKARDQKMARFIGITCHAYPVMLKQALEELDLDVTQMALNAAQRSEVKDAQPCFETVALPVAVKKQMGVIAMKVFAADKIKGNPAPEKLVHYSMSLPVTAVVIGMPKLEMLEHNVSLAKSFKPLSPAEMKGISGDLVPQQTALNNFFHEHADC